MVEIFGKTPQQWYTSAWLTMVHTPVEIAVSAVLGVTGATYFGHIENAAKAGSRPVAYSDIEKTERKMAAQGQTIPPLTRVQAYCNDGLMKFNEANNYAYARGDSHKTLATELEFRMSPDYRSGRQIPDYAQKLTESMPEAMESLGIYRAAMSSVPAISAQVGASWNYTTKDEYTLSVCTSISCNGKTCTTTVRPCTKYSHTWHSFRFNQSSAAQSNQSIASYFSAHPSMRSTENLMATTETTPDNEYEIEKSHAKELKGTIPDPQKARSYANLFISASNYAHLREPIATYHDELKSLTGEWSRTSGSQTDHRFKNGSRRSAGPASYQLAGNIVDKANQLYSATSQVVNGLLTCQQTLQTMTVKGQEYIGVVLDGKPGNPDDLRDELFELQEIGYKAAFAYGPPQDRYSRGSVVLYALGGLLGMGMVGFGLDRLVAMKHRALSQGIKPRY